MRPIRLELSGFTSFRDETVVDFDGADYFVFIGPTGSGKSTIIDAICFALYGSVPRYGHKGLVHPVITQGQVEAKVRLDFSIDGERYTAVRVVRRTAGGATTKEARLEREGESEPLAGNADELTEKVTELIGLTFDHFTKCVVLPQGEFARFLHDKPGDRQAMLIRLLSLGIYDRMRVLASTRATEAKSAAALTERRLAEDFADATKDSLAGARARVKKLEGLRGHVDTAMPKLNALEVELSGAHEQAERLADSIERLSALEVPQEIAAFGDKMAHAQKQLDEAEAVAASAEQGLLVATKRFDELPERTAVESSLAHHEQLVKLRKQIATGNKEVTALQALEAKAVASVGKATAAHETAVLAATQAKNDHAAQHLAGALALGEPCPVCLQNVEKLPKHKATPVGPTQKAVEAAERALRELETESALATKNVVERSSQVGVLVRQADDLEIDLRKVAEIDALKKQKAEIDKAEKALKEARAKEAGSRKQVLSAREARQQLLAQEREERRSFEKARDSLADLKPPPASHEDLVGDWQALVHWAGERIPALMKASDKAAATEAKLLDQRSRQLQELADSCVECEVDVDDGDIVGATIRALTEAQGEADRIAKAIEAAAQLSTNLKKFTLEGEIAGSLAHHLSAKGFEKWIVNEALQRLVEGAGVVLNDLSSGQYSLTIDEGGNFLVTDHHNANETRSAKTLSGGETFLASLALALSLSDQLAELSAEGSAKLDAIFLDEGFGTLDPEALDTVEASIANLAATGRMVGVVTHVRELADRVPLQFRVRKDVRTSIVERVLA